MPYVYATMIFAYLRVRIKYGAINTDYIKRCIFTSIHNCISLTHSNLSSPHAGCFMYHSNLIPGAKTPVLIQNFRGPSLFQLIWTYQMLLRVLPTSALVFQQNFPSYLQPQSHNIYILISGTIQVCTTRTVIQFYSTVHHMLFKQLWIVSKSRFPKTLSQKLNWKAE